MFKRTLSSIASQIIIDEVTVTIIDDCSTENYEDVISAFSGLMDIHYCKLKENMGVGYCRNYGFGCSSNPYVVYMDSDDQLYNPYSLYMLRDKIVTTKADFVTGKHVKEFVDDKTHNILLSHVGENMTWVFARIYSRHFLEEKGIYFSNMRYNEDVPYMQLAYASTNNHVYLDNNVYVWHNNESSLTHTAMNKEPFLKGKMSFVDGLLLAHRQKRELGIANSDESLKQCCDDLSVCYWYFVELQANVSIADCEKYLEKMQVLYNEICVEFPDILKLNLLKNSYFTTLSHLQEITAKYVPQVTFFDLLNDLESNRNISNATTIKYEFG